MALFTHNIKKIKGAAHKNGDVDGTRKGALNKFIVVLFFPATLT